MKFLADLLQQDMFVAVVSYLSIGLVFLVFFYYRERKWESDLAQYQITEMAKIVKDVQGKNNIYPFNRAMDGRSFPAMPASDEMQVIEGETIEPAAEPVVAEKSADKSTGKAAGRN
ncbi:hypothetical protein [Herbaspirillum rhizosphaerae]|uniref:hypothetical protein n=1 Tax=Herbaspirillum rhizosphaerae TaxID=346179 RepID=UPI000A650C0D|nr:hypothetical protein [Herbaspirillum rhizosphaerae]